MKGIEKLQSNVYLFICFLKKKEDKRIIYDKNNKYYSPEVQDIGFLLKKLVLNMVLSYHFLMVLKVEKQDQLNYFLLLMMMMMINFYFPIL